MVMSLVRSTPAGTGCVEVAETTCPLPGTKATNVGGGFGPVTTCRWNRGTRRIFRRRYCNCRWDCAAGRRSRDGRRRRRRGVCRRRRRRADRSGRRGLIGRLGIVVVDRRGIERSGGRRGRARAAAARRSRLWVCVGGWLLRRRLLGRRGRVEFGDKGLKDDCCRLRRQGRCRRGSQLVVGSNRVALATLINRSDHDRDRVCGSRLAVKDVGAGGAVRLDQHLEFRVGRCYRRGHREVDFHQHRGAANAHGRDRRIDLHVAVFGGFAGDKGDGAGHQADQRGIVRPVRVVDHLVEHHSRIRRQAEHGAVDEGDAERRIRAGLHHVALFDVVADIEDDRDAVADRGRGARELGDVADDLASVVDVRGLRVFDMARKRVDDVAGEMSAVGRRQRCAVLALEVIVHDQFVVVLGKDQVDAGPLEVSVEQQLGIRNRDAARTITKL